jgi:ubiquinone/menaquinone biosynthesis C-methylase UbiE
MLVMARNNAYDRRQTDVALVSSDSRKLPVNSEAVDTVVSTRSVYMMTWHEKRQIREGRRRVRKPQVNLLSSLAMRFEESKKD